MGKIQLSYKINLQVEDVDGVKEYNVTFRELKKKEAKTLGKESEEIINIVSEAGRVDEQISIQKAMVEALIKTGQNAEIILTSKSLERLYAKREKLDKKFKELGGMDALDDAARKTLEMSVGGDDKDAVIALGDDIGYPTVLTALQEELNEKQGK